MVTQTAKKGSYYRLSKETLDQIKLYANEHRVSQSVAIEEIVAKHFENRSTQHAALMESMQTMMNHLMEPMKEDLNRVRIIGNVIDKHTQMMLEFWNHYFVATDAKALGSTDKFVTKQLLEAEQLIKSRISHNRQKKLDWEAKRKKNDEDSSTNQQ